MNAQIATSAAKGMLSKIQWKNFITYAKITVWLSIIGQCLLPGYLMFKVMGEDIGKSLLWAMLSGSVEMVCGLVVAFFEVIPCLKCCAKSKEWASKVDICLSRPMLRSFLYMGLAVGQGVLIVYSVTQADKGGVWIFFMIAPSILLLTAGILYTVSFVVVDKCQWKKPGAGGQYTDMNDDAPRCTLAEIPQSEWEPDNGRECSLCAANFTIFKRKHHCRFCGKLVCKDCSEHKAVPASGAKREMRMCNSCKRRDDEAPKTAGEKMKAGFDNFGKNVLNVFKKNPFAKRGDDGGNQTEAAAASAPALPRAGNNNPFSSRRESNNEEDSQPKESPKKPTFNPFRR